jgi:hypothetical protein
MIENSLLNFTKLEEYSRQVVAQQVDRGIKTTCPMVEQASPIQSRKILQFFGSGLSEVSIKNSRTCDEASSSLGGSTKLKKALQNK